MLNQESPGFSRGEQVKPTYLDGLKHAAKLLMDYRPEVDDHRWWQAYNELAAEIDHQSCGRCQGRGSQYFDPESDRVVTCAHPKVTRWAIESGIRDGIESVVTQWEREAQYKTQYSEIRKRHADQIRRALDGDLSWHTHTSTGSSNPQSHRDEMRPA